RPKRRSRGHRPGCAIRGAGTRACACTTSGACRRGRCLRLALPDRGFDAGHYEGVLKHLADPVAAIREMRRVVRPGGRIAAVDAPTEPGSAGLPIPVGSARPLEAQTHRPRPAEFVICNSPLKRSSAG
ncbi:MAG: methyltransferase domain-containing protein, partial [Chloroflexi bacterium]|nr:methyltransferase domain-containing protein [Chloroflexota bacterium]